MASNELIENRYIFGSYEGVEWDEIYESEKEKIANWLDGLDKLIHVPFRLSILAILSNIRILSFAILKQILGATSGNLNNHLTSLEKSDLISIQKSFSGSRPMTLVALTEKGEKRFKDYLNTFFSVFQDLQ